jgi:hypothetical protein
LAWQEPGRLLGVDCRFARVKRNRRDMMSRACQVGSQVRHATGSVPGQTLFAASELGLLRDAHLTQASTCEAWEPRAGRSEKQW